MSERPTWFAEPSEAAFRRTMEWLAGTDLLVVGTVGRAALYRSRGADPELEIATRNESKLVSKKSGRPRPRDVDVIGGHVEHGFMPPHDIDSRAFHRKERVKLTHDKVNGLWQLETPGATPVLDPIIFSPVESTTFFDMPCRTVSLVTHYLLLPDWISTPRRTLLSDFMTDQDEALLASEPYQVFKEALGYVY
jgi:hypothetical protein